MHRNQHPWKQDKETVSIMENRRIEKRRFVGVGRRFMRLYIHANSCLFVVSDGMVPVSGFFASRRLGDLALFPRHSVLEVRIRRFYFQRMKRFFFFVLLAVIALPLRAQDSTTAAAIAERQRTEERYKRMSADIESLLAANVSLQKKISALESELQKLREDQVSSGKNNDTQETVRKLAAAIQEVDRNRETDRKKILDEIAKLGKTISAPATRSKPVVSEEPNPGPDKGYPYTIQSGDTLSAVLADYNAQFKAKGMKTISQKQVEAANPNVEWTKLKIGQKIFIPAPE